MRPRRSAVTGILMLLLVACNSDKKAPATASPSPSRARVDVTLSGTITIHLLSATSEPQVDLANDGSCRGKDALSDVRVNADLFVKDPGGIVLGQTTLDPGVVDIEAGDCTFAFSVGSASAAAYTLDLGGRKKMVGAARLTTIAWDLP